MNLKSKKGFSLVELIIVIAILGIIAVIAVPNLTTILSTSSVETDYKTAIKIGESIRTWIVSAPNSERATIEETTLGGGDWVALSELAETGLADFISTKQTVSGLANGAYFVCYDPDMRKVAIAVADADASGELATTPYKFDKDTKAVVAGVAYIEGYGPIDTSSSDDLKTEFIKE